MVKLFSDGPSEEIVREHLDYIAGEGKHPWDALSALDGRLVSKQPVDWKFVERQYREAHRRLPRPSGFGKGRAA